jgi:hypothetical protein
MPISDVTSEFEKLHRLRIRSLAPLETLGDVDELVAASLILVTPRGCMLTPAGLARHDELLEQWRGTLDLERVAKSYDRFLAVNQPVKDLCSRWQVEGKSEEALVMAAEDLSEIVDRVGSALRRAGQVVPRFETYEPRLRAALQAARDGDGRFITDPRVDSVHNIWFECHEDYLLTLGRDREQEGSF